MSGRHRFHLALVTAATNVQRERYIRETGQNPWAKPDRR
jgi:hypothetical protein